jgi:hypothetical protein
MKGMSYSDVMTMPVFERSYFLGLLNRDAIRREEQMEENSNKNVNSNSKGNRTTRISGDQLKHRIKSGNLPL